MKEIKINNESAVKTNDEEYLGIVRFVDNVTRKVLFPFLFLLAFIGYIFGVPYPVGPLIVLLLVYVAVSSAVIRLINQRASLARGWYFLLLCFDGVLGGLAIYYSGGIESFLPQALIVVAVLVGLTMPLRQLIVIILVYSASYLLELLLEGLAVIPHVTIFPGFLNPAEYSRSHYFLIIPTANILSFAAVSLNAYFVARLLEKRERQQEALNGRLEAETRRLKEQELEKAGLQARLNTEVSELQAMKVKLEKTVEKRENELTVRIGELEQINERLKQKMAESERSIQLAVGSELELIDLEKETNELLAELGRQPKC
jgi:hypothetical protein